jgi:hypothetical protein
MGAHLLQRGLQYLDSQYASRNENGALGVCLSFREAHISPTLSNLNRNSNDGVFHVPGNC